MASKKKTTEEVIEKIDDTLARLARMLENSDKGESAAIVMGICFHNGDNYLADAALRGEESAKVIALSRLLAKSGKDRVKAAKIIKRNYGKQD